MKQIAIVDYGMGNVQSVANALEFLGYAPLITYNHKELASADAYILPGVGAFAEAMYNLQERQLIALLHEQVIGNTKPFLGICLGMQLLAQSSEEMGHHEGLGWIPAQVIHLPNHPDMRIPHVGWNDIEIPSPSPLFEKVSNGSHFYFDHSFHMKCDTSYITAHCMYGPFSLTAAIQKGHIFATQFHPEKSQVKGLKLLRSFLNYAEHPPC